MANRMSHAGTWTSLGNAATESIHRRRVGSKLYTYWHPRRHPCSGVEKEQHCFIKLEVLNIFSKV